MGTRLISWNINHKPRSVSSSNNSSSSSRNTTNSKASTHVSLCLCVCSSQKRRILDQDFGYAYSKKQRKLLLLALRGSGHGSMANCRSFSFFCSLPAKNGIATPPIGANGSFDGHGLPYRNKATRFIQRKTLVFCSFPVEDGNTVRASDRINGTFDSHNLPYGEREKFRKRRTLSFYAKLIKFVRTIRSFLPGGTWWEIRGLNQGDEEKISVMSAMHRLWILIAPDGLIVGIAFFALVVAAFSEIAIPHYVAATIFSAQSGLKQEFVRNARFLAVVTCTFGLFSGIRGGSFGIANQILVQRMRERLFSTMLSQDIAFFDEESVGILTSRLGSDCQQVSRILGHDLNIMLRNALQGLGSFFYLTTISKPLALSTLIICSIMWCIMTGYGRFQRRVARSAQDSIAAANKVAEENLSLARVIRTFGTEKQEISRYSRWTKHLVEINLRQNVAYGFWTWSANTLYNATQVVALLIGGSYVFMGKISAEQLTKFVLYSEWVVHSTWWVGDHWALLMQSIGASEKVFELMDLPPSRQLTNQGLQLPTLEGKIQFKNVSFQYPTRPSIPVLRRVNLCIQPGEVVAVVGLSGSGKSTLAGLLLRHYDPSIGEILIDGVPLNKLDIKWLRRQLGVVSQEPKLFSTDIASNIAYGCGGTVTSIEIEKAAKQANAHDFIMDLPEGYRTMVDNARLSGGQKQRIAIARALVRDPSILILDEATSALDAESEHLVQKALHKAMHDARKKRTVLVIAHRLSTIRSADRIVVMQSGCISEAGLLFVSEKLDYMDPDGALLLDRLSSAADETNDSKDEIRNHEDLLGLAQTLLDPSTPSGEARLDSLGMDMPRILAKFAVSSHEPCREKALSILKSLATFCDPRDMFSAYMEALNLYSEPETLALCIILLDDLPQIFTRMRRRRLEFFQESLSGILRIYSLAVDTGAQGQEIFVKLAHIIMAVHGISQCEEVAQKRQRLQQTLAILILLLLARGCDIVIVDALQPTVLELINLLPECGFSYLDMITGNYSENVVDCIDEEACNSKSQLWDTKRGAVFAVCWSFCGKESTNDRVQLELFLENLCSSTDAFMKSLSNVSLLLTSISTSPKTVELCIDFLATILKSSTTKNLFDSEHWHFEQNNFFRLKDFLQAIQSVMIFSPHSKTRQHAYNVLVQTIRQVPPPVARYEILKLLIMESNQSSMVSLLIYIVKEEVEKAISSKKDHPDVAESVKLESPFASRKVLELVEFVLRPPAGGPPDLPNQIDAVLSVLNLYRFILIKETSGKTNYTGILRKENLEQARLQWLEPFRVFLQGYQLNLQNGASESDSCAQFSVANVEGVLYRCLELVEEALKCKSS